MITSRMCALFLLPLTLIGADSIIDASAPGAGHEYSFVPTRLYITPEKRALNVDRVNQERVAHKLRFGAALTVSCAAACATAYYVVRNFKQEQLSLENRVHVLEATLASLQNATGGTSLNRFKQFTSQISHILTYALPSMATQLAMNQGLSLLSDNLYSMNIKRVYKRVRLATFCESIILNAAHIDKHIQFVAMAQGYQFREFQAYLGDYTAIPYDELLPYLIAHVVRAGVPAVHSARYDYHHVLQAEVARFGDALAYFVAACEVYGISNDPEVALMLNELCVVHAELYQEVHKSDITAQQVQAYCVHLAKLMNRIEIFF